ncbi:MAG: glycosyltransferase family protein [Thiohalocapsa sp.]
MTRSVLFYVQYLLGVGHLQRSLRIAEALAQRGVAVTLVSGGMPVALPHDPAIRIVQLPPVQALDASFALVDISGRPVDEALWQERRAALLAAFAAARPQNVVIEGFPFARRAFRFELEPLIAAVQHAAPRARLFCSVRDIVAVRDDPQRQREIVAQVRRDFDAVLVHGDPAFIPFEASFAAAPEIADRLVYTGYVAPTSRPGADSVEGVGDVVVSAGGGAAGQALLTAALAARCRGCLAGRRWRLVTGAHLPEAAMARLREAAAPGGVPGVIIERFRDDLPALLRRCHVSVSQAGYNTVLELVAARARAVLVPFAAGRETEQLRRAERLAARGAAELVPESELTAARLAAAIERAAARAPAAIALDTGGAVRSAALIDVK